jgi:hypothetical protein
MAKDSFQVYKERDQNEIRNLLLGHSVVQVSDGTLTMDDGRILTLEGNLGCNCCGSGDYALTQLSECSNVITEVEFVNNPDGVDSYGTGVYKIFVFAEDKRINLATWEGSDGNGYYGTGYRITVTVPKGS